MQVGRLCEEKGEAGSIREAWKQIELGPAVGADGLLCRAWA